MQHSHANWSIGLADSGGPKRELTRRMKSDHKSWSPLSSRRAQTTEPELSGVGEVEGRQGHLLVVRSATYVEEPRAPIEPREWVASAIERGEIQLVGDRHRVTVGVVGAAATRLSPTRVRRALLRLKPVHLVVQRELRPIDALHCPRDRVLGCADLGRHRLQGCHLRPKQIKALQLLAHAVLLRFDGLELRDHVGEELIRLGVGRRAENGAHGGGSCAWSLIPDCHRSGDTISGGTPGLQRRDGVAPEQQRR
jgi:hypothetical protein